MRGGNNSAFLLLLVVSTSTIGTFCGGIGDIDACSFGFRLGSPVSLKYLHETNEKHIFFFARSKDDKVDMVDANSYTLVKCFVCRLLTHLSIVM